MTITKVLIVEDEGIVARDLRDRLLEMGYVVSAIAATGEEALKKAAETRPDLVLMDIRIKGAMDGIEVAEQLRDAFDIPPIYLTAYTDEDTLRRARITQPYGYIVKPFAERELHSTIEMALNRHKAEGQLRQAEQRLSAILDSTNDAVMGVDASGEVVFMNPLAEKLTGWTQSEALGRKVSGIFQVRGYATRESAGDPAAEAIAKGGSITLPPGSRLVAKSGEERRIDCRAVPTRDDKGDLSGAFLIFRETTDGRPL